MYMSFMMYKFVPCIHMHCILFDIVCKTCCLCNLCCYAAFLKMIFASLSATFSYTIVQGGQPMSRSRAKNGKYLAYQKKIISDQVRKSALSRVLQG